MVFHPIFDPYFATTDVKEPPGSFLREQIHPAFIGYLIYGGTEERDTFLEQQTLYRLASLVDAILYIQN